MRDNCAANGPLLQPPLRSTALVAPPARASPSCSANVSLLGAGAESLVTVRACARRVTVTVTVTVCGVWRDRLYCEHAH